MNALKRPEPRKVLVVDDDPSILAMTEDLLGEAGFEVGKCGSGREALERVRLQRTRRNQRCNVS